MDKKKNLFLRLWFSDSRYFVLSLVFWLYLTLYFFIFCDRYVAPDEVLSYKNDAAMIAAFYLLLVQEVGALVFLLVLGLKKRLNGVRAAEVFIFMALNAMVFYGFALPVNSSNYSFRNDWWVGASGSHWNIVLDIFTTGQIPDPPQYTSGVYDLHNQYYQTKLWHFFAGLFARFNSLFVAGEDTAIPYFVNKGFSQFTYRTAVAFETLKIFQSLWGYWLYILTYQILRKLGLGGGRLAVATALMCLLPFYAYIPFIYNNDAMMIALLLAAILFALEYHANPNFYWAILTALSLGFAMMSKINAGLGAFPIAFIFLHRRYLDRHAIPEIKERWFHQMVVFAIIVFPLGLFYPFFALAKYGEKIGYVLYPGTEYSSNYVNVNFYGVYNRFFGLFTSDLFAQPWKCDFTNRSHGDFYGTIDFNIWTGLIKTALFGNADFRNFATVEPFYFLSKIGESVLQFWLVLLIVLFAGLLYWIVRCFRQKRTGPLYVPLLLVIITLTSLISYLYFNITFPFTSTMHFRYTPMLVIPLAYSAGVFFPEMATKIKTLDLDRSVFSLVPYSPRAKWKSTDKRFSRISMFASL